MKSLCSLPSDYKLIMSVDLQKNKKTALLINLAAALIGIAMFVPTALIKTESIIALMNPDDGLGKYFLRFAFVIGGLIVYMILHELVHGTAMRICGTKKVRYGFTGLYAFAGSDDWYDKTAYIFIALAPIVVWGIVLAVICAIVPDEWFWIAYIIQIANISGAAGDLYVTARFTRLPKDILVRDSGVAMEVYSKETAE